MEIVPYLLKTNLKILEHQDRKFNVYIDINSPNNKQESKQTKLKIKNGTPTHNPEKSGTEPTSEQMTEHSPSTSSELHSTVEAGDGPKVKLEIRNLESSAKESDLRNEEIAQRINNIRRLASVTGLVTIALMFAFLIFLVIGVRTAQTEIRSPIFPTVLFVTPIVSITAIFLFGAFRKYEDNGIQRVEKEAVGTARVLGS